jgi:hypothetical protein
MVLKVMGKILVVFLAHPGDDDELRGDLADEDPIEKHEVSESGKDEHNEHVERSGGERNLISELGLEGEGRKDGKSYGYIPPPSRLISLPEKRGLRAYVHR